MYNNIIWKIVASFILNLIYLIFLYNINVVILVLIYI